MTALRIAMTFLLLLGLSPAISVAAATLIVEANGCVLQDGLPNPCIVGGEDWGETLSAMLLAGWFMTVSLPFVVLTAIVWLAIEVAVFFRRRNRI